jgi:hypothetical protein
MRLCGAILGLAILWAGGAQAAIPVLTPAEMNCGDVKATQDSGLNKSQADEILLTLKSMFPQKVKKAGRPGTRPEFYTVAFCAVTRNGQKYIVLDGIYKFLGAMICDDDASFGIVYDPRTHMFGDLKFGVSSCVPQKKTSR